MKHSYSNDDTCFSIDVIDEILEEVFDALLDEGSEILHSIEGTILKEKHFTEFDEFMAMTADENSEFESDIEEPPFKKITFNTDYKYKTSLEEPPTDLELKPLPDNFEYVFLEEPSFLPVILSSQLSEENKNKLVSVLKRHKQAFAWKTIDIPGICPSFCKYKIQLPEDKKPVVQKQKRLNPNMQEVMKKEIVKLLDTYIIYLIADSPWVSPIHYVPKKGGITVVTNKRNELVPTRTVTGWRICIDYRKLNEATAKYHFPLPFMDQMLERLAGNKYFCFLGECLSVYVMLQLLSKDAHLVLNWEKCHFMVKEGIVLGHKVSEVGLEVDKAKINVIFKLPPPTNIKEFDIEIKDRKGIENVAANHLSWIENEETSGDSEVDDHFPRETLMEMSTEDELWFADFVNYLASDIIPKGMTYQQKNKFFSNIPISGRNPTSSKYYSSNLENYKVCSKIAFMHATFLYAPESTVSP
ncbi:hypothetical protein Tco_0524388 [Tanacetum coccineum]